MGYNSDWFPDLVNQKVADTLEQRTHLENERSRAEHQGDRDKVKGLSLTIRNLDRELDRILN
jgi:hypothetical protein